MASLRGTGTEDKKKVAIAAALGLAVVGLAIHTIFGGPAAITPPASATAQSATIAASSSSASSSAGTAPTHSAGMSAASSASLDPALHPELMAENESYRYGGSGRNIFSQTSGPPPAAIAIPKVTAPIRPSLQTAVNTGPPPPPVIDLRFFGYSARKNGMRKAFLLHGDDVFVASEGDVVSHRYRVVRIAPSSIEVEDLPYHDTQTLPLIQN